jgi:calcium binding protein 39
MPMQFSVLGTSFWQRSQDLVGWRAKGAADTPTKRIGCLPFGRGHANLAPRGEAVPRLTQTLKQLDQEFPNGGKDVAKESLRLKLSEDVHEQVQRIFALIREYTGEGGSGRARRPGSTWEHEAEGELLDVLAADIPVQLIEKLPLLEFEVRKDVMNMFCALLWTQMPQHVEQQVVDYLRNHPKSCGLLIDGYRNEEVALHHGVVLRSCARHAQLAEAILASGKVLDLIEYARQPSFDIASDAFDTLKCLLFEHKDFAADWLIENSTEFFNRYSTLIENCDDYVVARQSLAWLGELLLNSSFKKVTLVYAGEYKHLKIHMNLLRSNSPAIQFEAFNVFKIFVANPNKTDPVHRILFNNKDKLVALLETLRPMRQEDQKFPLEQQKIIAKLRQLPKPSGATPSVSGEGSPRRSVRSTHSSEASLLALGERACRARSNDSTECSHSGSELDLKSPSSRRDGSKSPVQGRRNVSAL